MKTILYISVICILVFSCKKEERGRVLYKLKFANERQDSVYKLLKSANSDTIYSQFGNYIGSITPTKYITNFNFLFCQSSKYVINYTGNHWEDSTTNPYLNVDFSQNKEVFVESELGKNNGQDWIGCDNYEENEITFTYFSFTAYYFYQEFELPNEYSDVVLEQLERSHYFNSDIPERTENLVKAFSSCLFLPINAEWRNLRFNFGLYNPNTTPFILNDTSSIINGSFTPIMLTMPTDGESKVLYSTISFNTENLIQFYAGADNIPYTSDDIIIYAPDYWERVYIKMEIK